MISMCDRWFFVCKTTFIFEPFQRFDFVFARFGPFQVEVAPNRLEGVSLFVDFI